MKLQEIGYVGMWGGFESCSSCAALNCHFHGGLNLR